MDIPDYPTRLPVSAAVRRRIERSIPAVHGAFGFLEVLGEATVRRYGERMERDRREREAAGEVVEPGPTIVDVVHGFGCELVRRGEALIAADLALDRARRERRERCDRRDAAARALYHELTSFRDQARGLLRRRQVLDCPRGETSRDPSHLLRQAAGDVAWATDAKHPLPDLGIGLDWAKFTAPLRALGRRLAPAIRDVFRAGPGVDQALALRDRALESFDQEYGKGCLLLETLLQWFGLPTLAAAVRPHLKVTGRVGRPSKTPERDVWPDLVERVRAAGLLPEPAPVEAEPSAAPAEPETPVEPETPAEPEAAVPARRRRPPRLLGAHLAAPLARPSRRPVPDVPVPDSPAPDARRRHDAQPPAWPARALRWWRRRDAA